MLIAATLKEAATHAHSPSIFDAITQRKWGQDTAEFVSIRRLSNSWMENSLDIAIV
jgi:hypothetical protein